MRHVVPPTDLAQKLLFWSELRPLLRELLLLWKLSWQPVRNNTQHKTRAQIRHSRSQSSQSARVSQLDARALCWRGKVLSSPSGCAQLRCSCRLAPRRRSMTCLRSTRLLTTLPLSSVRYKFSCEAGASIGTNHTKGGRKRDDPWKCVWTAVEKKQNHPEFPTLQLQRLTGDQPLSEAPQSFAAVKCDWLGKVNRRH